MAELLTPSVFAERLGKHPDELKALEKGGCPTARQKNQKVFPWPKALHWFIKWEIERAKRQLPSRVTQQQLADLLSLTSRQIHNLQQQGLASVVDGGERLYPIPEAIVWYVAFKVKAANPEKASAFDDAKTLAMQADAQRKSLEVFQLQGDLVTNDFMQDEFERILEAIATALSSIPGRYSAEFVGLKTQALARKQLQGTMDEARRITTAAIEKVAVADTSDESVDD